MAWSNRRQRSGAGRSPRRRRWLAFEPLESRQVLSVDLAGLAPYGETQWVSEGETPPPSDPLPASTQAANAFVRLEPLGSLVFASAANAGSLASASDQADFTFHAQAGERIAAIVRPSVGSSAVLSVALVGTAGAGTAPGAGQAAVLGPTAVAASGTMTVRVTGSAAGAFTLDIYRNAVLEQQVGDSANGNELSLAGSALALAGGTRWAVVGNAALPPTDAPVYSENFDGAAHTFTFAPRGTGTNLWHVGTGRSADGEPGHSPPKNLYFGAGETSTGGGNYGNGGLTASGLARTPQVSLAPGGTYELRFNSLIDVEDDEHPDFDQLRVLIDNGVTETVVMRRDPLSAGELPGTTAGGWTAFSADLTPFAGQTIRVLFSFDTQNGFNNGFEGWYVDDVRIVRLTAAQPEVDEYTLDLTGLAGKSIDLILDGLGTSFAGATLELLAPNGTTVLATGSATHSGVAITNFDQGVLGFVVPAGGVYTVRLTTTIEGHYLLAATESLSFDTEPNSAAVDPQRALAADRAGLGHVQLAAAQTSTSRAAFLLANPGLTLENFEEAVLAGELATVTGTLQNGTARPPVFTATDIQPGLRIDANFPGNAAGALIVAAANAQGVANPSKAVGADRFADNTVISFTSSNVFAVGFDVRVLLASPLAVAVNVYDTSGQRLATQDVSASASGAFFGVTSNVAIGRIELISSDAELVDDIVFGAAGSVPTPSGDIYTFAATLGQVLAIETRTPLDDGASVPGNLLNPRVVVRDPSGVVVASDQNSAPDGKNARLTFTAAVSGTFTVEVLAESGSGEYTVAAAPNAAPRVTGVYARGPVGATTWNTAYTDYLAGQGLGGSLGFRISSGASQLTTLPWVNLNTLVVTFSEDVSVTSGALQLLGAPEGPSVPGVLGFNYDAGTFTATWTFASALVANKYLLHFEAADITDSFGAVLDGNWTTSVSTVSGDGAAGDDFNFRFYVVPGDVDNSLGVVFAEVGQMRLKIGRTTGSGDYNYRQDLDASSGITFSEVAQARLRVGSAITGYSDPAVPPAPPPPGGESSGESTDGAADSGPVASTTSGGIDTAAWDAAVLLMFGEKKKSP